MNTPGSSGLDLLGGIEPAEPPVTPYLKDQGDDNWYETVRYDPTPSEPSRTMAAAVGGRWHTLSIRHLRKSSARAPLPKV